MSYERAIQAIEEGDRKIDEMISRIDATMDKAETHTQRFVVAIGLSAVFFTINPGAGAALLVEAARQGYLIAKNLSHVDRMKSQGDGILADMQMTVIEEDSGKIINRN